MVHHISKQTCVVTAVYYNLKCGVNQRPIFVLFGVSGNIFYESTFVLNIVANTNQTWVERKNYIFLT